MLPISLRAIGPRQARATAKNRLTDPDQAAQTRTMNNKKATPQASPVADFEHSLNELEALVQKMEKGEQSLDDSLASYERGVALYRRCQAALEQAEQRVQLLNDPGKLDAAEDFKPDAS